MSRYLGDDGIHGELRASGQPQVPFDLIGMDDAAPSIRFPSRVGVEHGPYTLERSDVTGVYSSFPPAVYWLDRPGLDKQIC
jgi:hypothetical protein